MPTLDQHQSSQITKLLLLGDSGSGKTGALTSLVKAGYKLRILDFDNGLDILRVLVKKECPDKATNVEYRTLRDKYTASAAGPIIQGIPDAFTTAVKMLDSWKYGAGAEAVDLGKPATWGPDSILVIDSLTFFSDAAYHWAKALNSGPKVDGRQIYFAAQQAIESVLAMLSGTTFNTNVIVIAHIRYSDMPDGAKKGLPNAVGSALGPTIPAYFNSMAQVSKSGSGTSLKRILQTVSTALIDLKNPAPFALAAELPIETALADFFKAVRG